jgi:sec-independent protein translocase protein TatA
MFGIGGWEIVIVLLVVLLLFGKRIPGVARSLGLSITEFRKGTQEGDDPRLPPETDSARTRQP